MHELTRIVDVSAWTGSWPFLHLRHRELPELEGKLRSCGVQTAFVSSMEAILEQDPSRANRVILQDTAGDADDFFSPVPIVDLSYADWPETAAEAATDARVRMLKILPNYHRYELCEERIEGLVRIARERNLIICVQIRVEDTRGQYPLMKVEALDMMRVARTLSAFPEQTFLLNNCYLGEVEAVLPWMRNVYVDTASLEVQDILRVLRDRYGLDRFVFAGHCPFYYLEGNVNKLVYADVGVEEVEGVAWRNAEMLLSLVD